MDSSSWKTLDLSTKCCNSLSNPSEIRSLNRSIVSIKHPSPQFFRTCIDLVRVSIISLSIQDWMSDSILAHTLEMWWRRKNFRRGRDLWRDWIRVLRVVRWEERVESWGSSKRRELDSVSSSGSWKTKRECMSFFFFFSFFFLCVCPLLI